MSYKKQNFTDGQILTHTHLNNIENGLVAIEKQIPTDSANYWAGKKLLMNGDSGPYGSALASIYDAFPYVVAGRLGMSIINYSIGGSTIAKRTGDYDECYVSWAKWEEDKAAGKLDTSKKYLVNTEKNPPRIYQIYSYKNDSWVGGGTASTSAGRTPLCDRILAMDTEADVIMIQCGSNDWYYDWNDLGDFDTSTYRSLGYSGAKEVPGQSGGQVGEIDTSVNLLESAGVEFLEKHGTETDSSTPVTNDEYFIYRNVPIIGGRAIQAPMARRCWWLDADGDEISSVNFSTEATNYTVTAPSSAAYFVAVFKYEHVQPADAAVYMSVAVEDGDDTNNTGKSTNEPCETFYDGLHKMFKQLLNRYKNKDIIVCSPIKRRQYKGLSNGTWDCCYPEDTNHEGKTIKDYCDAIKKVCEYYSVPFIDLYTLSGLNPHIDLTMFADTDGKGAHPSIEGHKRIASVIIAQMQSLRK